MRRCLPMLLPTLLLACAFAPVHAAEINVTDDATLRQALSRAQPGDVIRIQPGTYPGSVTATLLGAKDKPITLEGDAKNPPVFQGGGIGIHLLGSRYVHVRNLHLRGATGNGLNIDDASRNDASAVGIVIENVRVTDVGPRGNNDGIKLSGVSDFIVRDCHVEGWGGNALDMVGCHNGIVERCTFRGKPGFDQATGPQIKGGSAKITLRHCKFDRAGHRAINCGGSTGLPYFRPPDAACEAKEITIEHNLFRGSDAPVAFVGVDGAIFRDNIIYKPDKWVLRILQESRDARFVPCRNVKFESNVIVYDRASVRTAVNISPGTHPETFTFARNWWWCDGAPQSRPDLPTKETDGKYGVDPQIKLDEHGFPIGTSVGTAPAR